jgi:hypothetical protein
VSTNNIEFMNYLAQYRATAFEIAEMVTAASIYWGAGFMAVRRHLAAQVFR